MPGTNAVGRNTAVRISAIAITGPDTSDIALSVASFGESPCSMWCSTASTTTIASSTTMPIASTRASSEIVLIEKPNSGNSTKGPTSETATASSGAGGQGDRGGPPALEEDEDHEDHEHDRFDQRVQDLGDALADRERGVERDGVVEVVRKALLQLLHQHRGVVHRLD